MEKPWIRGLMDSTEWDEIICPQQSISIEEVKRVGRGQMAVAPAPVVSTATYLGYCSPHRSISLRPFFLLQTTARQREIEEMDDEGSQTLAT